MREDIVTLAKMLDPKIRSERGKVRITWTRYLMLENLLYKIENRKIKIEIDFSLEGPLDLKKRRAK
jgi:hypothetical protein